MTFPVSNTFPVLFFPQKSVELPILVASLNHMIYDSYEIYDIFTIF